MVRGFGRSLALALVCAVAGAAQAQAVDAEIQELNAAAEAVAMDNPAAVKAFKEKRQATLPPLAGYGNIPWGASPKAAMLLADVPLVVYTEYNQRSVANENFGDDNSLTMTYGICEAPPPIVTCCVQVMAKGDSYNERRLQYYFVDGQLYAVTVFFMDVLARSVAEPTVMSETWKGSNWELIHDTLVKKYGPCKERVVDGSFAKYVLHEWESPAGVVRMVVTDKRHEYNHDPETKQLDFSGLSYFSKDLNRQARERRDQFFAAETRQAEEAKKKSDDEARKRMTDGVL